MTIIKPFNRAFASIAAASILLRRENASFKLWVLGFEKANTLHVESFEFILEDIP